MTDKLNKFAWAIAGTALAVIAIAAFAAIQSFSHIYQIAHTHGQDHLDSALMPLSVDGLIVAASLVMLHFSRAGAKPPWLARFALWLGIGVTVAANVGAGLPWGAIGALVSVWAAVSFVIGVELLMVFIRKARAVAESDSVTVVTPVTEPAPVPVVEPVKPEPVRVRAVTVTGMTARQEAAMLGKSQSTIQRWRRDGSIGERLEAAMANGNGKAHG